MRGYRIRAVNGRPIEEIMKDGCAEMPCENVYRAYASCTAVVRSFKFVKNLFPNLDPNGGITYSLESPDGTTHVDRTVQWEVVREIDRLPAEAVTRKMDSQTWLAKPVRWAGLER